MSNPFRAIGGAYGQKWAFWAKNGRFRVSGDPRCHFLGALKAQTGHPGCVWQCPTLFNQCPTHLEPLEVPMCENGHHWQNMAIFGASGAPRCHFLGALRAQTGHPGCVWQCPTSFNQCPTHLGLLGMLFGVPLFWEIFGASRAPLGPPRGLKIGPRHKKRWAH